MKKTDIQTHRDGFGRKSRPAVNVKVYSFPTVADVQERFPACDDATAEKALECAFENSCSSFWECVQDTAEHYLSKRFGNVKVYSEGRSGGWLVVEGASDIESWNALDVSAWGNFARAINSDVQYRTSKEYVLEDIEANEYYKPLSDRFNFIDAKDGSISI